MELNRIEVLGVPVDCVSLDEAIRVVDELVCGMKGSTIIAINPEKIVAAESDMRLAQVIKEAELLIPDGIGVVFAAWYLGLARMQRVAGADLMPEICRLAAEKGYRLFLYGGRPSVNERACNTLKSTFPKIKIVGSRHGYVTDKEMPSVIEEINTSNADILFVALGSPKQELWIKEYLRRTNVKVCQGVGGTFDVLAGEANRAPMIFRKMHLEWTYRLLSNPARIHRHKALAAFAFRVIVQRFSRD